MRGSVCVLRSFVGLQLAPDELEGGSALCPLCFGEESKTRLLDLLRKLAACLDPILLGKSPKASALFFVVHPLRLAR
ncbi:MAG TPA: hypothetical protein VMA33_09285 [Candidatus Tectomicrobia bacterium]|nr:hypothetical protein [Candidatus Tectomicrobia bacterium]